MSVLKQLCFQHAPEILVKTGRCCFLFLLKKAFHHQYCRLLRAKHYDHHQPMATPLLQISTSPVLPLSVGLRPGVQLHKLAAPFGKKDPLYDLSTSHFIMLSVCHNAAQMMEQLIIHLALGCSLTSRGFSGYVRVHNTSTEKRRRERSCSKQWLDSEKETYKYDDGSSGSGSSGGSSSSVWLGS